MQTMKWKMECGKVSCHLPVGLLHSARCIKEWDERVEAWTCRDTATGNADTAVPASQVIRLKVKLRLKIEHLIWASDLGQGPLPPLCDPP